MKETGIIRKVDDLGRISIPKSVREDLGIADGTPLEFFVDGDSVVIKRYYPLKDLLIKHISKCEDLTKDQAIEIIEKAYEGELKR